MERPIEYWRDMYLIHSKSRSFQKKVDEALGIIEEFVSIGSKNYCTLSGGKDSSVLTHLVSSIDNSIPVLSEKDDLDFPGEVKFVSEFCSLCDVNLHIVTPDVLLFDLLVNYDFTDDLHSQGTRFSEKYFYGLLRSFKCSGNYKGVFLGLRSEESKGRRINGKINGPIYYNKRWKQLVCQPLINWSGKDVFAYLFSNSLPILPIYFQTAFHDSPEEIRKSWIIPSGESQRGKAVWLRHYYPDLYAKLMSVNPKIRCYV